MLRCESSVLFTLSLTTAWVIINRNNSIHLMAKAMYLPAISYFLFTQESWAEIFLRCIGWNQSIGTITKYSTIGMLVVCFIVGLCLLLVLSSGSGKLMSSSRTKPSGFVSLSLYGFLRAAGEEIGWRVYLLPCLMAKYHPITALLLSGIYWAGFHVPVMIVLGLRKKNVEVIPTVVCQALSCVLFAFIIGHLSIISGSSMWTATLMHGMFNHINPPTLGSLYTQNSGAVKGRPWVINGEGLAGVIVMLPMVLYICYQLY